MNSYLLAKLTEQKKMKKYDTIGIDLLSAAANDILVMGARPLTFLDYIANDKLDPLIIKEIIDGMVSACKNSGVSLVGGETAEMPGFYPNGRYDLAGFCVGIVEHKDLIDGTQINPEDQIIGIKSNGLHSNGFSLVRKVLSMANVDEKTLYGDNQSNLIQSLLEPTAIYAQLVEKLLRENLPIHGMTHITGGGLPENLPRVFPSGLFPHLDKSAWEISDFFYWLTKEGDIPEIDLWTTFNMGIGFCIIVPQKVVQSILELCADTGFQAWNLGKVIASSEK